MPAGRPITSPLCATCGTDDPALFYPRLKRVCRKCHISEKKIYYETRKVNSAKNTVKKLNEQTEQTPIEKLSGKITELTIRIQLLESQLGDHMDKLDTQKKFDDILITKISDHAKNISVISERLERLECPKGFISAFV